jgi:hypothetical protein
MLVWFKGRHDAALATTGAYNIILLARFGEVLSRKARQLLIALGLSEDDITSINLESVRIRGLLNYIEKPKFEFKRPTFQPLAELPGELLDPSNRRTKSITNIFASGELTLLNSRS